MATGDYGRAYLNCSNQNPLGTPLLPVVLSSADIRYCSMGVHVRVWDGSIEARPNTCHCGAMTYTEHRCACGNVHETESPTVKEHLNART